MSKKSAPLATAVGTAILATAGLSGMANAAENPFALHELERGYSLSSSALEGGCGEGKCGEGKCGDSKSEKSDEKSSEHNAATELTTESDSVKAMELSTGDVEAVNESESESEQHSEESSTDKASHEGKCGEGKCGG